MADLTREALAAYAHEAWAGWMLYLFRFGAVDKYGAFTINADKVERWQRQMRTPYAELSETEKASDRAEADKMLAIVGVRLAALEAQARRDAPLVAAALAWHEATPHLYGEAARRLFEAARAHRAAAVDGNNPTED
jgi:hypothetical protein